MRFQPLTATLSTADQTLHRTALLAALVLGLAAGLGTPVRSDEISELNDIYESMSGAEATLLDMRRDVEATLSMPDGVLVELPDGDIIAMSRADVRDNTGMLYDMIQHLGISGLIAPLLPPKQQGILRNGVATTLGRIAAADMVEDFMLQNQETLRQRQRARLAEIEEKLEQARTIAASAISQRDQLVRQRDAAGVIDGGVCLDPNVPADRQAMVASRGYGGGTFPVKGSFICTGGYGYLWDTGAAIREYRCNGPDMTSLNCELFSELAYEAVTDEATGQTTYWLEDERTYVQYH